jgi:hypothetical protein
MIRYGPRRGEQGQSLLLAIIIMLLLALVGAGFIATVAHDLQQSEREAAMVSGKFLAEAGIRYANEQLTHSLQGADWRPTYPDLTDQGYPLTPSPTDESYWDEFERVKGWSAQGFVKYPDPRAPGTPSTPSFGEGYVLLKVEYAPQLGGPGGNPGDPGVSRYIRIEAIGRPTRTRLVDVPATPHTPNGKQLVTDNQRYWTQVAYKPVGLLNYLWFITDREHNPTPALLGLPWIDSDGDGVPDSDRDGTPEAGEEDHVFVVSGPVRSNKPLQWATPVRIDLHPSQGERVEVAGGIEHFTEDVADPALADVWVQDLDGGTMVNVNPSGPGFTTVNGAYRDHAPGSADPLRQVRRLEAPDLGLDRPDPVTGQSRFDQLTQFSGVEVTDVFGQRRNTGEFGYGAGIFIDNGTDRQDRLFNRNTGQFEQAVTQEMLRREWMGDEVVGPGGEELLGTWQQRTYIPPGVEVVFFDSDPTGTDGRPKIWMRRSDFEPSDPTRFRTWKQPNGADTGEFERWFNYPANGVILAEGNIRLRGRLPLSNPNAEYNLVVVSRGIIYVEGNLLRPYDLDGNSNNDNDPDAANTRIALLARDHVVINPTPLLLRTVPNPEPPKEVPEAFGPGGQWVATDPLDRHWVLDPTGVQRELLIFDFGKPNSPRPYLTVKHADQNDGPPPPPPLPPLLADIQIFGGSWFGIPGNPVPPGVQGTGSAVTAPYPSYFDGYQPDTWDVSGLVDRSVGVRNYVRFQTAVGSTHSYHLTNAKIERFNSLGQPIAGLDLVVSAAIYAEHGTFFVIPCDWFDPSVPPSLPTLYRRYKRYNYRLCVNGAIAVSDTPPLADVGVWSDRWSYPTPGNSLDDWGFVDYTFDRGLPAALPGGRLRFRNFPLSPDLVYVSERG